MADWLKGDSIGAALWQIVAHTNVDVPFTIWDTEGNFHDSLLAKQDMCQIRSENDLPKEIVVVAFGPRGDGPYHFVWIEDGQTASIKPLRDWVKHIPIRALKIGNP